MSGICLKNDMTFHSQIKSTFVVIEVGISKIYFPSLFSIVEISEIQKEEGRYKTSITKRDIDIIRQTFFIISEWLSIQKDKLFT